MKVMRSIAVVGVLAVLAILALPSAPTTAASSYRDVCEQTGLSRTPGGPSFYTLYEGNNVNVRSITDGLAYINYPNKGYMRASALCPR